MYLHYSFPLRCRLCKIAGDNGDGRKQPCSVHLNEEYLFSLILLFTAHRLDQLPPFKQVKSP